MKAKKDTDYTYTSFLQTFSHKNNAADEAYILQILSQFRQLSKLSIVLPNTPAQFVIDYGKRQYIYFSNSLGNHRPVQILEGGLEFMISLMPAASFKTYNEQIFPAILEFLSRIAPENYADYIVSFNHKIIDSHKNEIDIYQRCTYITSSKTGLPAYCIGMILDISHFKNDDTITLSFEKKNNKTGIITLIEKKCFSLSTEEIIFTPQEKNILQYMADGLSGKMIANKLAISTNTLNNHRTNMMRKTGTKNVAQLIAYAFQNKLA